MQPMVTPPHMNPQPPYKEVGQRLRLRQDFDRGKLKVQPNLTPLDQQALNSLQSDKGIIIKPADKGGGIVVMDKIKYTQEAYRQLYDTSIYTPLDRDPTNTIKNLIKDTLMKYCEEGVLDQKTCEYLIKQNPITPVFYILPKIHKNLNNPPGRPIVASTESILSPISKFLEKILTPLIQQTPSFLLDTGKFLELIHNLTIIPKEAFLVTFDVKDLYTSIPHIEGIKSVRTLLTSSKMDPVQINLCCDLLSIILTKNFFLFEDQFFLQTRGTAMGSNAAPPYANCYMADYEESAIYTNCLFKTHALMWKRYIDDIFCIWDGPDETLKTFFLFLKTSWPGLDFTITYNQKEVNFLDTLVCKNDQGELSTDLFTKPTDRNSLLHYHSFHPTRMKNAIPKSQFKRVHRIVSDKTRQTQRLDEMRSKFLERGYPPQTLNTSETISTTRTSSKDRIPFVHDYHPLSYILHRSIRRYWHILGTAHPRIKEFKEPFLPCFRRPRNICDKLVRADIGTIQQTSTQRFLTNPKYGTFPCLQCTQCNNVTRGSTFYHPHNGKQYNIKGYFTCDTSFVVYLIKCPCGLCYIGETTQPIKDRISKHKSTIRLSIQNGCGAASGSCREVAYQRLLRAEAVNTSNIKVSLNPFTPKGGLLPALTGECRPALKYSTAVTSPLYFTAGAQSVREAEDEGPDQTPGRASSKQDNKLNSKLDRKIANQRNTSWNLASDGKTGHKNDPGVN
ncbi:unnamed protein product [Ranitomeya imitator]|uniref:Reverse transcriptase domain-containing protein n=1 Tax=Ranitomeya imitator TaxID=111125 RepID=A0ABN9MPA6_9NEOB|nr:unnamed protein product [Ranitomeya imitator]